MSESLKDKTVKGVSWTALSNVLTFGVSFVISIILARLLSPEDYGLLGLTGIFTALCGCFISAGLGGALIRKKNATEDDFNTVFICNLVTSIVMYVIIFLCAPLIADFFERQELIPIVRVSSLSMIIGALGIVQSTRLTKRIDFKTQTKITVSSTIVQGVVGIGLAFAGFGVWALVYQGLTSTITRTSLLYCYNKWIPKFYFSKSSFKELFGYSSKMLASDILSTLWGQLYSIVIAKCYSPATLGQYSRATGYSGLFANNLTGVVQRVSFPVLSEIQDDKVRLKSAYQRLIKTTMLITFSCTLMLAAVAKPLLILLIGVKWLQSAEFLQIICLGSMLYPLHAINLNMLLVQGRSDIFLKLEIIKKVLFIFPILIGVFVGIYWMLVANVIIGIIAYYLNAYPSGKLIGYSIREQVKDIMPSFLISFFATFSAWMLFVIYKIYANEITMTGYVVILILQIVVGFSIFFFLNQRLQLGEYIELRNILLPKINQVRTKFRKIKNR